MPQLVGREPERLLFAKVRFVSMGKEPTAPQLEGSVPAIHRIDSSARQCACARAAMLDGFLTKALPTAYRGHTYSMHVFLHEVLSMQSQDAKCVIHIIRILVRVSQHEGP